MLEYHSQSTGKSCETALSNTEYFCSPSRILVLTPEYLLLVDLYRSTPTPVLRRNWSTPIVDWLPSTQGTEYNSEKSTRYWGTKFSRPYRPIQSEQTWIISQLGDLFYIKRTSIHLVCAYSLLQLNDYIRLSNCLCSYSGDWMASKVESIYTQTRQFNR